ncbi:inovirus-type Gp2 protein [Pseudomonas asuensis]|uniref:YagK/YfjJ domain-containing protein n=1 Tax=Pseudomonas asuensis TaxID=1825787 RepID=UPI0027E4FD99|nr:inovirus-type Gp2 protein [Pseudomonas asuensis]
MNEQNTEYLDFHHSMNVLVARIRQLTHEQWYQRRQSDRRYEAGQHQLTIAKYINQVLDRYSRTVVVRVDLHYLSLAQVRLRIEHVFRDLEKLIRARERNSIFDHETGYICSVEQGKSKGYHIHCAFFFNGAEVRSDFFKARKIGDLWKEITQGRGYYHSCNEAKESYGSEVGIGPIRRDDSCARDKVLKAIQYLAKEGQHLRLKPTGSRCIRMGRIARPL